MCMFGREFKRGCLLGGEGMPFVCTFTEISCIIHGFEALVAVCCFYGIRTLAHDSLRGGVL